MCGTFQDDGPAFETYQTDATSVRNINYQDDDPASGKCLVTDNFGLFTEITVCKFLRGWRSYGPKPFLFCPLYVFIHFSAAFCTAYCALDLARDHAP